MLHGVNQHYGLIAFADVMLLLLRYCIIAIVVAVLAKSLLKEYESAIIFAFALLCSFFLFGALKDLLVSDVIPRFISSYRVVLPAIIILVGICVFILKVASKTSRKLLSRYVATLLVVFLAYEVFFLVFNVITRTSEPDFGDRDHKLIEDTRITPGSIKPDIFWIVMDEYSASQSLQQKWNFANPLDSILRNRGFFVADSATSPYNFTHYSFDAMLDMTYLNDLPSASVVRYRDMVLGDKSVYQTNVVEFLQRNGYAVNNFTMFDMQGMPAHPYIEFRSEPSRLISDNTMYARIKRDIGWNFNNVISSNKKTEDANDMQRSFKKVAAQRDSLTRLYRKELEVAKENTKPNFFMFQFMLTHEPFLYNADGSIHPDVSFTNDKAYLSSVAYANTVITSFCDQIISTYRSRNFIIIFQSDHGFKFDESDSFFSHSCRIPFAVYSSDQNNEMWMNNVTGVNIFRILFNKYFNSQFPLLDVRTNLLRYRQ